MKNLLEVLYKIQKIELEFLLNQKNQKLFYNKNYISVILISTDTLTPANCNIFFNMDFKFYIQFLWLPQADSTHFLGLLTPKYVACFNYYTTPI